MANQESEVFARRGQGAVDLPVSTAGTVEFVSPDVVDVVLAPNFDGQVAL